MTRQLASIQKIVSLDPIPEADRILKATVLGWEVVVAKKDELKVGNLVCYIEVDSIVPEIPEFEFLRERKFRVRTIKLKKQISQGLVLPLSVLPKKNYKEGDNVTEALKIKKYDPQADLEQKLLNEKLERNKNKVNKFLLKYPWYRKLFYLIMPKKLGFPRFIKKTDEDRIQLFPDICEREKDTFFVATEKLDGQSGTYFLVKNNKRFLWWGQKYIFGVCSRNIYLPKTDNSSYWWVARNFGIKSVLENLIGDNDYIVLQGEIIGQNIQGNKYKINGYDFYAFNLIYPNKNLNYFSMSEILIDWNIKSVPLLDTCLRLKSNIPEMVDYSNGKSVVADTLREGIVVRNQEKNISFKVVSPEFLLKYNE